MANPTSNIRWFLISDVDITELKLMIGRARAAWHGAGMAPEYARRADWRHTYAEALARCSPRRSRPSGAPTAAQAVHDESL